MHIVSHKLSGVSFIPAQSAGRPLKPELIILHDTASRLNKGSVINWFTSPECNVSAHVVVERDGSMTQMVSFNQQAFHAGKSEWKGRQNCNGFSIGVEIVHPGLCDKDGRAWYHKKNEKGFPGLKHIKTKEHGDGWWMEYTPEQVKAVTELCQALVTAYPDIEDVTAHFVVSPKRKVDVCPLFPLEEVRQAALGIAKVATLPSVEPEVVKPPSVIKAAYESKSVWALLMGAGAWVAEKFKDSVNDALDWAMWGVGILPSVVTEVKTTLTNGEMMAAWFKLQWPRMALYVTVGCLAIAIIRHVNDKRKLAQAQQK